MPRPTDHRSLSALAVITAMLAGSLIITPPVQGGPGDLNAPVYTDGDWWNYTVSRSTWMPARVGSYDVGFDTARGWLRYEVDGTSSHGGVVAWSLAVTGGVRLSGEWSGEGDAGTTGLEATVSGREWRSVSDLSYLGSDLAFEGEMEIATNSGPEHFNITLWENRTVRSPFRVMLFPVPVASFPKESHNVTITTTYACGDFSTTGTERWDYVSEYRGLAEVSGSYVTFTNQHRFQVKGNLTVGSDVSIFDRSVYYDASVRKAASVDNLWGLEIRNYHVSQASVHPDLVVVEDEFNASHVLPPEGTVLNLTAQVHNLGQIVVHQVDVELWASLDGDLPFRQNSTTIESIASNGNELVYFEWAADQVGEWEFSLRVDPTNTVTEAREDNNVVSMVVTVIPYALKPNLLIEEGGLMLNPPSPIRNHTGLEITATVSNVGEGDALNVTVDFFLGSPTAGGRHLGWQETIDLIPVGQSRNAGITWTVNVSGSFNIWAYVDQDNAVNETLETDNLGFAPVLIVPEDTGGVDLVVASVKVMDSFGEETQPIPEGERTRVRVVISNEGPENAERVHLSVYVDTEDPAGLIGSNEGRIIAKEVVTWEVPWVVDVDDGEHYLLVTLVGLGEVERDTEDNRRGETILIGERVQPIPEALEVTVFPDANTLAPGQNISVSGKVTYAKNGFEVPGATVKLQFQGVSGSVTVETNEQGRYLTNVVAPSDEGSYRLLVTVTLGRSEADSSVALTVRATDNGGGNGGSDDEGLNTMMFIVSLVIVLSVTMPLTYYFLVTREALKRRVRRVHEEVVEIVEDERG